MKIGVSFLINFFPAMICRVQAGGCFIDIFGMWMYAFAAMLIEAVNETISKMRYEAPGRHPADCVIKSKKHSSFFRNAL